MHDFQEDQKTVLTHTTFSAHMPACEHGDSSLQSQQWEAEVAGPKSSSA